MKPAYLTLYLACCAAAAWVFFSIGRNAVPLDTELPGPPTTGVENTIEPTTDPALKAAAMPDFEQRQAGDDILEELRVAGASFGTYENATAPAFLDELAPDEISEALEIVTALPGTCPFQVSAAANRPLGEVRTRRRRRLCPREYRRRPNPTDTERDCPRLGSERSRGGHRVVHKSFDRKSRGGAHEVLESRDHRSHFLRLGKA